MILYILAFRYRASTIIEGRFDNLRIDYLALIEKDTRIGYG